MAKYNKSNKSPLDKMAEELADLIVDRFSSVENWKAGWKSNINISPYNETTKKEYRGYNALTLLLSAQKNNFNDPRWMTFNQAKENDYKVKPGSKSTRIGFFNATDIDEKTYIPKGLRLNKNTADDLKSGLNKQGIKTYGDLVNTDNHLQLVEQITDKATSSKVNTMLKAIERGDAVDIVFRSYSVFNGNQIEGLPELEASEIPEEINGKLNLKKVENIIDNCGVEMSFGPTLTPVFKPSLDKVEMPSPEYFIDAYEYYATFMHELAHSTMHENRVNRDVSDYAREELVAEFASMLINNKSGLQMSEEHFDNHAAYLKGWSERASKDPRELFNVIREAGKAAEYVLELANQPDNEISTNRATFNKINITDEFKKFKSAIIELADADKISPRKAAEKINKGRMNGVLLSNDKKIDTEMEI